MLRHQLRRAKNRLKELVGSGFPGSQTYWDRRYQGGGTSGDGSYSNLAGFKADYINCFVAEQGIETIVELGCGDGNQLTLADYPSYVGVDVSPAALERCSALFHDDGTKTFTSIVPADRMFDLSMSLDVIYHLIEEEVFERYMRDLFGLSRRFVLIYSSDCEQDEFARAHPSVAPAAHVRHRRFSGWIERNAVGWRLLERTPNRYPFDPKRPQETSFADFHLFERTAATPPVTTSGVAPS